MNESFSLSRFKSLFARYWAEKKLVQSLLALSTILLLSVMFYQFDKSGWSSQLVLWNATPALLMFIYFVLSLVQMSQVLQDFASKRKQTLFMQTPATKMEKFVYLLVNGLVLPLLFFWISAWVIDKIMCYWVFPGSAPLLSFAMQIKLLSVEAVVIYISLFIGYFVWKKNHLLYSIFSSFIVFSFGINELTHYVQKMLLDGNFTGTALGSITLNGYRQNQLIDHGLVADYPVISTVLLAAFYAGMIWYAYARFEEKQVKA